MKRATFRVRRGLASAILTADLHLTEATPVSRTDDYIAAQARKLQFLQDTSRENGNCPILCAGDVFHTWKASPWLCRWVYQHLPVPFVTIPGNHDLPMHSHAMYDRSALALLEAVFPDEIHVLKGERLEINGIAVCGVPFGEAVPSFPPLPERVPRVLLLHVLVWTRRGLTEGKIGGDTAKEILAQYGQDFDLIVTGDNHDSFVETADNGAVLVNPGSMMRSTVDQEDFRPRCYLYYGETNEVIPLLFPIDEGVHNREHIDRQHERDARIAAYVDHMGEGWGATLSFQANLQAYFAEHNTPKSVQEVIWQHLEAEKI